MVFSMTLSLQKIVELIGAKPINNAQMNLEIIGLSASSQNCKKGFAFVAVQGVSADGHDYINEAFDRGATIAVVSDLSKLGDRPGLLVEDTRRSLSKLASIFAGEPSKKLLCIGITGTNGKTTINWLLYNILQLLGEKSIRIGTLGTHAEGVIDRKEGLTTPDPVSLHEDLALAFSGGVKAAVLEASSHALHQERVSDVDFDIGVYTNLTRDHLDYHGDMENYFKAKFKLFEIISHGSKSHKLGVINIDCPYGRRLLETKGLRLISYGTAEDAMLRVSDIESSSSESLFFISFGGLKREIKSRFIGHHNALNIAGALGVCLGLGYELDFLLSLLPKVPQVPGRLEYVEGDGFDVFVDYAHTPDALENALRALKNLSTGDLWVLFGCGGDRDKGKRPQMAEIAARNADKIVVTSDNPRTEDPQNIIDDILSSGIKPDIVNADRREAIWAAIQSAERGDVLLVAGKGHEDYQIIGKTKIHFSDVEEIRKALAERASKP